MTYPTYSDSHTPTSADYHHTAIAPFAVSLGASCTPDGDVGYSTHNPLSQVVVDGVVVAGDEDVVRHLVS